MLFSGDGGEEDGARRRSGGRPGLRDFQQDAAAGAVVDRAVVDVVAFGPGVDAEVIVVRGVEDGFIAVLRI